VNIKRFHTALKKSPLLAARVLADRVVDRVQERRLGIRSSHLVPIETLVEDWHGNHDYAPTSIRAFRTFMEAVNITGVEEGFVDYGCGMGRTLVLASEYPFRRIIGVEISTDLAAIARENLGRQRSKRLCHDIQIWCGSAERFELPEDASVLYFFNPFHGPVLTQIFNQIGQSLAAHSRRLRIIFNNPTHFRKIAHNYPWLIARRHFSFEHDCIIYESKDERALWSAPPP
jgi:SAM-dependent methyltransferase